MIVNLNGFVEDLTVEQLEGSGTSPPNAPKFRFFLAMRSVLILKFAAPQANGLDNPVSDLPNHENRPN